MDETVLSSKEQLQSTCVQKDTIRMLCAIMHFLDQINDQRWPDGAVVRASDFGSRGPCFEPWPVHISLWP